MDIWLVAVLLAWVPVAAALGVLVGRTLAHARRREHLTRPHPGAPGAAPAWVRVEHRRHEELQRVRS